MFTDEQLRRIREIIRRHHQGVGVSVFGPAAAPDQLHELSDLGLMDDGAPDLIEDSSAYARLLASTGDARLMERGPVQIVDALDRGSQRPLTAAEEASAEIAARHAGQYLQGLGDRVTARVMAAVTGAEASLTPDQIRDSVASETSRNRLRRETVGSLRTQLRQALPDWERDFHRIALTETNNAVQEGVAQELEHEHGDPLVSKLPRADACPDCVRLYTEGGTPIVFRLSELRANGSNVGRKRKDWKAVVEAMHPWCACVLVRVPEGMVWEGRELVVDETEKSFYVDELNKGPHKLHYRTTFQGIPISIENRKGSNRHWDDEETGEKGKTKQHFPYGYIRGVEGKDGDEIDCYLGPKVGALMAYVVHQRIKDGDRFYGHDEDKVMLGFGSRADAKAAYLKHFDDERFFGAMSSVPMERFKTLLEKNKGKTLRVVKSTPPTDDLLQQSELIKTRFPVGTVRVWRGARYQKQANGKWKELGSKKSKREPSKRPGQRKLEMLHDEVIKSDPVLTDEQRKRPVSSALVQLKKRSKGDPQEWGIPAGARVRDPWTEKQRATLAGDPTAEWSHPDFGKGTGPAPWEKSEDWSPDLHKYDHIVVNSSGGKDSQAQLTQVVNLADKAGYPREKIVVVHADLGRVEWEGTKTLARQQAEHYGLKFEVVRREQNDLIEQIEERHGNLTQRDADIAALASAGIRTWEDLAGAKEADVLAAIGEGKGAGRWLGGHRARELIKKAQSKGPEFVKKIRARQEKARVAVDKRFIEVAKRKAALLSAKTPKQRASAERLFKTAEAKYSDAQQKHEEVRHIDADVIDFGKAIAWPSSDARYCTSDHKRVEVQKLHTRLSKEHKEKHGKKAQVKILNALGIRLQESESRAKMEAFSREKTTSNQVVDRWYPIHRWHEERVWEEIKKSGVPHHKAYDLGMRRLSCVFCVFAGKEDIMLAAKWNPDLFDTYLELEEKVGASFKADHSLADVRDEIQKQRSKGFDLTDQAKWVKKALDLDTELDLIKADLKVEPTAVNLILEAGLQRLNSRGQKIQAVALEWKPNGACVHLDTDVDSHHVEYLPYPNAYNASLVAAAFAQRHGLRWEEHNEPPPLNAPDTELPPDEEVLKSATSEGSGDLSPQIDVLEKTLYPVGTVRKWRGGFYKKISPKRWVQVANPAAKPKPQLSMLEEHDGKERTSAEIQDGLEDVAKNHGVQLDAYFASGSNHPGEIRGFARIGMHLGVAAPEVNEASEKALHALAGTDIKVFVDSGAFSEVAFTPAPTTVKPISDEEWDKRLNLYERLAGSLGENAHVVAPDKVGYQKETIERLTQYAPRVREIREVGATILVPLQKGELSLADMDREAERIIGDTDWVRAIPMKKDATTTAELEGLLSERDVDRIHLLGLGPKSSRYPEIIKMIARVSPQTKVTVDSVRITAAVGRGTKKNPKPRIFTAAQDRARAEQRGRVFHDDTLGGYTDQVSSPSGWTSDKTREKMATAMGLGAKEAKRWVKNPDAFLQEPTDAREPKGPKRYEDPSIAGAIDAAWLRYTTGEFEGGKLRGAASPDAITEKKTTATVEAFGPQGAIPLRSLSEATFAAREHVEEAKRRGAPEGIKGALHHLYEEQVNHAYAIWTALENRELSPTKYEELHGATLGPVDAFRAIDWESHGPSAWQPPVVASVDWGLYAAPLRKSGPFIGPRGGKWADAAHTIPWKASPWASLSLPAKKLLILVMRDAQQQKADEKKNWGEVAAAKFQPVIDDVALHDLAPADAKHGRGKIRAAVLKELEKSGFLERLIHTTTVDVKRGRHVFGVGSHTSKQDVSHIQWRITPKGHDAVATARAAMKSAAALRKSGPFIGKRGGKWADAAHTIPWKDNWSRKRHRAEMINAREKGIPHEVRQDPKLAEIAEIFSDKGIEDPDWGATELHIKVPEGTKGVSLKHPDRENWYALVHPSSKEPGKWQASYFDERGPSGDSLRSTLEEALHAARHDYGYIVDDLHKSDLLKGSALYVNVVQGADDVPRPSHGSVMIGLADEMGLTVKGKKKRKKKRKERDEINKEIAKKKRESLDVRGIVQRPTGQGSERASAKGYIGEDVRGRLKRANKADKHKVQLILEERERRSGNRVSEEETMKHFKARKRQHSEDREGEG